MDERTASAVEILNSYHEAYLARQNATGCALGSKTPSFADLTDPVAEEELREARARLTIVLDEILPGWRAQLASKSRWQTEDAFLDRLATDQVIQLTEGARIRAQLRGGADEVVADTLHRWVWTQDVARRWSKSEYGDAVAEAAKSVNAEVQRKISRTDMGETKLFQFVFGTGQSSPQSPRLRFGDANPHVETDRRRGAMEFSAGWFTAVRNLLAHRAGVDLEEYGALEYLAALSIIARWSDEAHVDTGPDPE